MNAPEDATPIEQGPANFKEISPEALRTIWQNDLLLAASMPNRRDALLKVLADIDAKYLRIQVVAK